MKNTFEAHGASTHRLAALVLASFLAIALALTGCPAASEDGGQTPTAADYDIGNLTQYAGDVTAVTVTAKTGKSKGSVTVFYAGSTTLPQAEGTYAVTFDVAAAPGWKAAKGLSAGTLTVNAAGTVKIALSWDDEHEELAATAHGTRDNSGAFTVDSGNTITFTVENFSSLDDCGWFLNGTNTGTNSETYTFNEKGMGKHTVGLLVEKDGKWYSTNFDIIVQ
jgi:membrane carboxypeptidase/penicillin-binding protein PbpC